MKILYLTVPSYFDLEISLIRELSAFCEVEVLMIVSPSSQNLSAFSISKLKNKPCIINATEWEDFEKYKGLIDRKQWWVANNPDNSIKSCYLLSNQIRRFIKGRRYDLIHSTTDCKTTFFLLPHIAHFKNTLFTTHDPIPHNDNSKVHYWVKERLLYRCYNNLLFLSNSLIDEFKQRIPCRHINIYYSRLGIYDFLNSYPIERRISDKYILFFGRIEDYKGVDVLVSAFKETNSYNNGVKLVIAGKGDFANKEIAECDNKYILLNRYIPNNELAALIANCEFVVLPYKTATQSGCVMSAFAFNKPILATSVGDLPLEIEDGKSGNIVLPNNISSLAQGIDSLLSQNIDSYSLYIKEKYSGKGNYSWTTIAKKLSDTYRKIIQK